MVRTLILALLVSLSPQPTVVQDYSVLHIKVLLLDGTGQAAPVPRHALLISDNPATAAPRRVVTSLDGTAEVRLRPGSYTVESDRPVAFLGKAYQWTQTISIAAGRDATLDLTAENAEVEAITEATAASATPLEADPSPALSQWQAGVVALWTPTTHASGFLIDGNGLIATNERAIRSATSVEVQLTPSVKVAATVLAANHVRDVAVLWIDAKTAATLKPVPLGCAQPERPAVTTGQKIFTIGTALGQPKTMTSATVQRVDAHAIHSDLLIGRGSSGGPVFAAGGAVVGMTSTDEDQDEARIVRVDDLCEVRAFAEKKMTSVAAPSATPLPVEPAQPFPVSALREGAERRAGSIQPYQMSAADFDIAFMTPVQIYGAQYQAEQASRRGRGGARQAPDAPFVRPLLDFANWSDYMADFPPVLAVRVTPRMVESFWTKMARGAAQTQGVALPPMKHLTSGFFRLRALCGTAEIPPIHPFKLERQVSDTEAIYEGLYLFDPGALAPSCGTVKLVLYSEKDPDKADTRPVDPQIIEQIWQDFAPLRPAK